MKKIFSLFAAVLFAGSMMAAEVVFTNADFTDQGTSGSGSAVTATKDGVTVSSNKAYGASESLRVYQGAEFTITAGETIAKINFTTTGGKTGGLDAEVTVGATTYTVASMASQARFTEIKVTLGEGGEEPEEPATEATLWKVAAETPVAAESELINNDLFTLVTPYDSYVSGSNHTYGEEVFAKSLQIRAKEYPTAENLIGENNNTETTADNKKASPLVLTAKENVEVVFYYRQQQTATAPAAENDNKDLKIFDQAAPTTVLTGVHTSVDLQDDSTYAYVTKKMEFAKGHVYTLTAKGTTLPLFGLAYAKVEEETPEEPVVVTIDTISCDSAAKAAAAGSTAEVYVKGYVTEIAYAWANGSMSFWMADTQDGGRVFEAYKCAIADKADAVNVGDLVIAHGNLAKYNTTYELAEGCTVEIIERAPAPENLGEKTIAEFLALKNTKDTCILTGVVDSIKSTTYGNLYLSDETAQVYIYGVLNAAGESKKFAELDVEAGDTLTVKAIYGEYNNAPQVNNAIFVSVAKAPVAPADTIEITITEGLDWQDETASEGWWQVYGQNEEYFITLSNGNVVSEVAGTYTVANLDPKFSYVRLVNSTDKITFTDGSVTVTTDEETESVLIAGTLVGIDGNVYVITLATSTAINPYQYDEEEADFVYDFESYEVNDTYAASYGVVFVSAETDATAISLYIILPQGQTALAAGEYAVTTTPTYGTVKAGSYDGENINPSLAATLIEQGGKLYYNEIWYLVSGTVTVDADLNITVDALNSKEKAIKATLKGKDTEAIDAVDAAANAVKALRDGQLIIEKNGQIFNVLGAQIR